MDFITGPALVDLERAHLIRLAVWSVASIMIGIIAFLAARSRTGAQWDFWRHLGIQCAAWGAVDLCIAAAAWSSIAPRDFVGAVALDRFLWLNIGLDVGYVMVGATLMAFGLRAPRRAGLIGAGVAIVVQGAVLVWLDALLSASIVR